MTGTGQRVLTKGRRAGRLLWRRATANRRPLPDFVLLGAMRAGTTSLFRDLQKHPQMVPPMKKEIHYFDYHHADGLAWYRAHFPTSSERDVVQVRRGRSLTGEGTPNYLAHPYAPRWAADELPETRFIVLLRDPVERAFSHWKLMTRLGHETLPFAQAVARETDRIGPDWRRMQREPEHPAGDWFRFSYVARGRYAEQLERWFDAIDRSRFLVVRSEDHHSEPGETWDRIIAFIGADPWRPPDFSDAHGTASQGPDPDVAARLRTELAPDAERLTALLGANFAWG